MTLRERYGTWVLFLLVVALVSYGVMSGAHNTDVFQFFFPLNWLAYLPFSDVILRFTNPVRSAEWWPFFEIIITIAFWMLTFFVLRGMYYTCKTLEGASLWVMIIIFGIFAIVFFGIILYPVIQQLGLWWQDWPGMGKTEYIGQ